MAMGAFWIAAALTMAAVACAAEVPGENLLSNGGAEQGTVGQAPPSWNPVGEDGKKDFPLKTVPNGRSGAKAIMIDRPAGYEPVRIQQSVSLQLAEPSHYRYSVWLRGDSPMPASADLFIDTAVPAGAGFIHGTRGMFLDVGTEWTLYSVDFYTPEAFDADGKPFSIEARLSVQLRKEGPLYIDDASFGRVSISAELKAQIESLRKALNAPGVVQAPYQVMGGIVPGPDGTLLAFKEDFTLRRSTDGGITWGAQEKLAIDDRFDRLSGVIRMRSGDIGIWSAGGRRPLYFWRSADGGKTWSKRILMGPEGERQPGGPYHGNAMIEMASKDKEDTRPVGWDWRTCSRDGEDNPPGSRSKYETVLGGTAGVRAVAMTLDEADRNMGGATQVTLDRPIAAGDRYRLSASVKASAPARFGLYLNVYNPKTTKECNERKYFDATTEWKTFEVTLETTGDVAGVDSFRVCVPFYTQGAQLVLDDVRVERITPEPRELSVANASFEQAAVGRLVLGVRESMNAHAGIYEPAGAFGTINGKRIKVEGHGHDPEIDLAFAYYSDDGGRTWSRSECHIMIWKDDGLGGIWPCDEPNIAQLKDGRLLMFVRTLLGRLYQCSSSDGGRRWSQPEPTNLPSSYSPCSLEAVPANEYTVKAGRAGDLLCVWNNVSREEVCKGFRRARLCSAVSRDDGKTWEHVRTLAAIGVPPLDEMAQLDPPAMTRADREIGELPMPFGTASYPDITVHGDSVLVQYYMSFRRPNMSAGGRLHIRPLAWFYGED